jgi:Alpha/beta hydrolase
VTSRTVGQARAWRPDALREVADAWDGAADGLAAEADGLSREAQQNQDRWTGLAGGNALERLSAIDAAVTVMGRRFVCAAVAARDGATRITAARDRVLALVDHAEADSYLVADDGSVTAGAVPELLRLLCGGDVTAARVVMTTRATELTDLIRAALDSLADADTDAARDIDEALSPGAQDPASPAPTQPAGATPPAAADIVAGWPSMGQDRIAEQVAAMSPEQQRHLIDTVSAQVGNTDGVPWPLRVAANRLNIADVIVEQRRTLQRSDEDKIRSVAGADLDPASAERRRIMVSGNGKLRAQAIAAHDADANRRIAFYQGLLAEVDDPTGRGGPPTDRQILAFDPQRASLVELSGDLGSADSVGVLVPGLNTTVVGSAPDTETARRFVAAGHGKVAMITYLGGPFPTGDLVTGIVDAAHPRYAEAMAPRLVAFSEDVNRTVDAVGAATGRSIAVTYIGHSYGGSILGTAERLGLTADRTMYVEAAGAGVGVEQPGDWHNRNPDVQRYSMTAPADLIELVQGFPASPHGADPDEMAGVTRLDTGRRLDGSPMFGPAAHSGVLNEPSDAWRNIIGVITGDRAPVPAG